MPDLDPPPVTRRTSAAPDDMQVSQDAADFLAIHGKDGDEIWAGLKPIFENMPQGRPDLMRHWEAVAARIEEMALAQQKPKN